MDPSFRTRFDQLLEEVLRELPPYVQELLNKVPLVVEDFPSPEVRRRLGLRWRDELCGLYTGIPLTERSIEHSGTLSDVIHIYRYGIMASAQNHRGELLEAELRRQIRTTILHEFGHHHGLGEVELRELGY